MAGRHWCQGNEGVANQTTQTGGAVGYVEYAYVKQTHMTYAKLINRDGKAVAPEAKAFQTAAANADWAKARATTDPDQPGRSGQLADHRRELHPRAR